MMAKLDFYTIDKAEQAAIFNAIATEKETIRLQLHEIEAFAQKIDELIAEGYDPALDDGVGKNLDFTFGKI